MQILPSIFSSDLMSVGDDIRALDNAGCEMYHLDIMDGHFVPNLALGIDFIGEVRKQTNAILDVHIMSHNPESMFEKLEKAGANRISFHIEANSGNSTNYNLDKIHDLNMQAGIAINPETPIKELNDSILNRVDIIILMSVHPGFAGQKFIKETIDKLHLTKRKIKSKDIVIQMDGGVNKNNVNILKEELLDEAVVGSGIYKGNIGKNFRNLSFE